MAKTKVVVRKTTSKKKGMTRRSGTVGGSSTKNYAVKYRNIDYKYRLVDIDETYSAAVFEGIINAQKADIERTYGSAGLTKFLSGLMSSCYFIPLTTSAGVCRNMNVNIKCKYPFAYCVFQNTPDFYKYIFQYVVTRTLSMVPSGSSSAVKFPNFYIGNAGQYADSILFMPCARAAGEDLELLVQFNSVWQEGVKNLFSRICQNQSTYKEVYSATNSGLYTASVNVYYRKASQFLSGPQSAQTFAGYNQVNGDPSALNTMWKTSGDVFNGSEDVQTVFKPGDMTLCVLPVYYFYNKMLDASKLPVNPILDQDFYPISFDIKRRVYRLNQDTGLVEAAQQVIGTKTVTVPGQTINQVARMPAAGTQGNVYPTQIEIVRQVQQSLLGRRIVRTDLDTIGQNSNCVIVDSNCYDPSTEQLQMQAYMDLQPNAPVSGTSVLNNFEDEDTMNCNVITQAANVDFEQFNQVVQLPYLRTGTFSSPDSQSIQTTNTGPFLVRVTNNTYKYNVYPGYDNANWNFAYNPIVYNTFVEAYNDSNDHTIWFYQGSPAPLGSHTVICKRRYNGPFTSIKSLTDNIQVMVESLSALGVLVRVGTHSCGYNSEFGYLSCATNSDANVYVGYTPTGSADKVYFQLDIFMWQGQESGKYVMRLAPGSIVALYDGSAEQYAQRTDPFQFTMLTALQFLNLLTSPVLYAYDSSGTNSQSYYYLTLSDLIGSNDSYSVNTDFTSRYVVLNSSQQPVIAELKSELYSASYINLWLNYYQMCYPVQARGEGWKRFKGFLGKAWKFIKNAIPIAKKVTSVVAPFIPGPYGTTVTAVADKVSDVITNLDTLAFKKTSSSVAAAVMDDDTDDVFEITPQYRISDSPEPVDIGVTGTDWVDGESFEQQVNASGVQLSRCVRFDLTRHPVYGQLIKSRVQGLTLSDSNTRLYMQQRLKVRFLKRCSQQIADAYKAVLTLGNDTNYFTPDDYQVVQQQ